MTNNAAAQPIWDFVLGYYRQDGVSEAAIALQDSVGIDVNMILFLMWLSGQGKTLAEADMRKLGETSHVWQRSVVVPIRNIRRLLKENAPFVEQETALAYRKKVVQALEIEGEQLELNGMADAAKTLSLAQAASSEKAACDNLATFAKVTGKPFPADAVEGSSCARWREPSMASEPKGAKEEPRRLIVGISGASGAIYGVRLLEKLQGRNVETHLILSKIGRNDAGLRDHRLQKPKDVKALASVCHPVAVIGASISSGSFRTMGMVIVPVPIRTMSEIATGVTTTLMSRAADVVLKEKRRLVLCTLRMKRLCLADICVPWSRYRILSRVVAPIITRALQQAENGGRHHQSYRW